MTQKIINAKQTLKIDKRETYLNVSLGFNVAIVILVLIGSIILYCELNPFQFPEEEWGINHLRYFTNFSALLSGFLSVSNIVLLVLTKKKKIGLENKAIYSISLIETINMTITMVAILFIMLPYVIVKGKVGFFEAWMLVTGSNLISHILLPLACIINFVCFTKPIQPIKLKDTLYNFIILGIYAIMYASIALSHINPDGTIDKHYDWYRVFYFGYGYSPLFLIAFFGIGFLASWLLWLCNKKINANKIFFEYTINAIVFLMGILSFIWPAVIGQFTPEHWKKLTHQSALYLSLASLVHIIFLSLCQTKKIKSIPQGIRIFKMSAVVTTSIVVFFAIFVMTWIYDNPWNVFDDEAVFTHLLQPLFAIASFIFLEHDEKIKFRYIWLCLLPITYYLLFYLGVNWPHLHPEQGWISDPTYDWYEIFKMFKGLWPLAMIGFEAIATGFTLLYWFANRHIHIGQPKPQPYFNKKANH